MAKGLPRHLFKAAIAKIKAGGDRSAAFKWAWAQHRGGRRSAPSPKSSKSPWNSRSSRSMAKKGGRRSRGWLNTGKIFKLLRVGALVAPAAVRAVEPGVSAETKIKEVILDYTGFAPDGSWQMARMARGWMPFIGVSLVTYGVPKLLSMIRRL